MKITQKQADDMLTKDLVRYENIVNDNVHVPLTQNQFDALVSLCYNVEAALSPTSSVVRNLNEKNYKGAAAAILLYNKPSEIIGRRRQEYQQFLTPYPIENIPAHASSATIAVAGTAVAASYPHLAYYILGGTVLTAAVTWFLVKYFNKG